jgi:two-component system, OmpR family, sensor kinase
MFKARIFWAFSVLALASVTQGILGWSTLNVADQNIQRGRVANELLVGFVSLSAEKQRLRILLSEALIGRPINDDEIRQTKNNMTSTLDQLDRLAARASELYQDNREMDAEHAARFKSLLVLRNALGSLDENMMLLMRSGMPYNIDWTDINRTFDMSDGLDLRTLLAESISRERLATARDRAAANASIELLNAFAITATLTLSLLAVLLALYFSKALSKPLRRIADGARELESGNLDYRIPEYSNDEFSELAKAVNRMARELSKLRGQEIEARTELERLVQERTYEVQEGLHRMEKLDLRRRQMFADISHELKTPTTAIRGEAEITLRGKDKDTQEYKETLLRITDSAKHLGLVIEDMLTLARSDIDSLVMDRSPIQLKTVLEESLTQLAPQLQKNRIEVNTEMNSQSLVLGDRQRLKQMFTIVLDNAVQYSPPGSEVRVDIREFNDQEGNRQAEISVTDQGIGISEQDLARVWDRHFRSDGAKRLRPDGHGLGLPLASALTRAHFGQIEIHSEENVGTRVVIVLPVFEGTLELEQ